MADTHLGYKQYNLDIREQDIYDAFNQAIDIALEERADVIVHSGDLFDSPRPPIKALYVLSEALRKIEGKIKFVGVLGEHDIPKRRGMMPHRLFNFPTLGTNFELEHLEINGVLFAGISNMRSKYSDHLKEELKKFDVLAEDYKSSVLILHQAFKKFLPFEGAYQLTLDDLPKRANYYAIIRTGRLDWL
jgi:DNA repair exonuclease SbcCD nuclease subunit